MNSGTWIVTPFSSFAGFVDGPRDAVANVELVEAGRAEDTERTVPEVEQRRRLVRHDEARRGERVDGAGREAHDDEQEQVAHWFTIGVG